MDLAHPELQDLLTQAAQGSSDFIQSRGSGCQGRFLKFAISLKKIAVLAGVWRLSGRGQARQQEASRGGGELRLELGFQTVTMAMSTVAWL